MIGIFGGTFDPVHYGHLRIALEMTHSLRLARVRFIPCRQPPHRDVPHAPVQHRLAMLRIALAGQACFAIDERELQRSGPSYMVDTLASLREGCPGEPLCLMLGLDAFMGLPTWHQWQQLIELAHIAVARRPGSAIDWQTEVGRFYRRHLVADVGALHERPAGGIVACPVTQLDISATQIRKHLADGSDVRYLLPDGVVDYIKEQGLYQSNN